MGIRTLENRGIALLAAYRGCVDAAPAVGQDVLRARGDAWVAVEVFAKGQFGGTDDALDVGEAAPRLAIVVGLVGRQRFARHVDGDVKHVGAEDISV